MPDINNPITDALDEMMTRKAKHMVLQTNDHPQLLINGSRETSALPVMTSEEIIEDCSALGMNRQLMENCNFFYSPDGGNVSHVFRISLTGQDENFFIGVTFMKSVPRVTKEEWTEF